MNPQVMQEMAVVGGGKYLPAETRDFDLGELYNWIRGKLEVVEFDARVTERRHARFQWLLVPALLLVMIESFMTDRKRVSGEF
jgi:Ca-activated chloride channel family protein